MTTLEPAGIDDPARLRAVRSTGLLDTAPDEAFDGLARLAASLLDAPFAFVTLVDDRRSFWKSRIGIEDPSLVQNDVEESFCQYVVNSGQALIVDDVRLNPLTSNNPSIAKMGVAAWAGYPLESPDGHVLGSFCVLDVRAREWTQRDAEVLRVLSLAASREVSLRESTADGQLSNAKLNLLVEAGQILAESLEVEKSVGRLARLIVPLLGDWCVVSVVQSDGQLKDLGWWHATDTGRELVEDFVRDRLTDLGTFGATQQAKRNHQPVVVDHGALEAGLAVLVGPRARQAYQLLMPDSYAVFPMAAGNRVNGVLAIMRDAGRVPMSRVAIEVATGIAHRAGLALENARLFEAQRVAAEQLALANARILATARHDRVVARALQDALLPKITDSGQFDVSARYLTADGADQVGGDFYDVIVTEEGVTTLVIGDVSGHDIAAAAVMGRITNMLRALVSDRPAESPAEVLGRLDRVMRDLRVRSMTTAALVRIDGSGVRQLRWSNAGHLPPICVSASGEVRFLSGAPDRPLGVNVRTERVDHLDAMDSDATLILYTDGLVETRSRDVDTGLAEFFQYLKDNHRLPLDGLLDGALAALVSDQPTDDVAIVGVRLRR